MPEGGGAIQVGLPSSFASTAGAVSAETIERSIEAQKGIYHGKGDQDDQTELAIPAIACRMQGTTMREHLQKALEAAILEIAESEVQLDEMTSRLETWMHYRSPLWAREMDMTTLVKGFFAGWKHPFVGYELEEKAKKEREREIHGIAKEVCNSLLAYYHVKDHYAPEYKIYQVIHDGIATRLRQGYGYAFRMAIPDMKKEIEKCDKIIAFAQEQEELAESFVDTDDEGKYFTMLAGSWYMVKGPGQTASHSPNKGLLDSDTDDVGATYNTPFHPPEVGHSWEKYIQWKKIYWPRVRELLIDLQSVCEEVRWQ